ncbi:MAG: BlaI/MecI/CopY family transcriptional regulator [Prevotella sp.]|nr:BlaI/MecI/CopY family transcriptional regulator [Prevotella sp.]MCM1074612.1 BlaI/MecI/CopY family transcriptional regulator [Ruminococcus sp.]
MKDKIADKKSLSAKEEEIMTCFWQKGPLFVREVVDMLPDPKPHFNTVSTFVRSLEAKGWLTHEQIGNSYRYSPAVDAVEYRNRSFKGLIDRFFGNSYMNVVSALVKEQKVSAAEVRELLDMIEAQKGKEE